MNNFSAILSELEWRGLLQDISDREGIEKLTSQDAFYFGCDPTAPSLTIGNLVGLVVAMRLGKAGMPAILLFGGATGFIGDPKATKERPILPDEVLRDNVNKISRKVESICQRQGFQPSFVNNYDWTKEVSYLTFLREIGKFLTVNYMLAKDVVRTRLEGEGISYTEFSYMLLQAFDFLHLYQNRNCRLQLGGSDQWGNITAGLELIRKKINGAAFALSWPLITDSTGKKFGKSEGNGIFIDADLTSVYRFHQFWLNVPDADVIRYLKIYTFLERSHIEELATKAAAAPEKRLAQNVLADEVCTLVHGAEATALARKSAEVLFGGSLDGLTDAQLTEIFAEVPSREISREKLITMPVADVFAEAGLATSKSEARRLVQNGGAYFNNVRLTDEKATIAPLVNADRAIMVLRSGKKNYCLLRLNS